MQVGLEVIEDAGAPGTGVASSSSTLLARTKRRTVSLARPSSRMIGLMPLPWATSACTAA
jgi:hypothetical protein